MSCFQIVVVAGFEIIENRTHCRSSGKERTAASWMMVKLDTVVAMCSHHVLVRLLVCIARSAPPPAPVQGGSVLGGIGATIADGIAFGTGSAIAHRAVDSMLGPRTIQHEMVTPPAPAATAAPVSSSIGSDACNTHYKAFQDCINNFGSDISKCHVAEALVVLWASDRAETPLLSGTRVFIDFDTLAVEHC
ncbi:CHCH domain, partial [Musa troglodytarum]